MPSPSPVHHRKPLTPAFFEPLALNGLSAVEERRLAWWREREPGAAHYVVDERGHWWSVGGARAPGLPQAVRERTGLRPRVLDLSPAPELSERERRFVRYLGERWPRAAHAVRYADGLWGVIDGERRDGLPFAVQEAVPSE